MPPEDERERVGAPEPEQEQRNLYDELLEQAAGDRERTEKSYVVYGDEQPWEVNRHARLKRYCNPLDDDSLLPDVNMFKQEIPERNGRHTHQGGVAIFGLEGDGETFADGDRIPWGPGDLIVLPVTPGGGIEHQHFNRDDPDDPALWLALQYWPFRRAVGNERIQHETAPWWDDENEEHHYETADPEAHDYDFLLEDLDYDYWADYEAPDQVDTLYDDLFVRRNEYRNQLAQSKESGHWVKIAGDDLEWEWNPQGKMKWYMHPAYDDKGMKTLLFAVQEIPPGSRSGKQFRQGFVLHYVLEGEGYSVVDGERFDWSAGDAVILPVQLEGHTVQHFNSDPDTPARFIIAEPFVHEAVGYDLGCGLEQLDTCPEYADDLPEEIYGRPDRLTDS